MIVTWQPYSTLTRRDLSRPLKIFFIRIRRRLYRYFHCIPQQQVKLKTFSHQMTDIVQRLSTLAAKPAPPSRWLHYNKFTVVNRCRIKLHPAHRYICSTYVCAVGHLADGWLTGWLARSHNITRPPNQPHFVTVDSSGPSVIKTFHVPHAVTALLARFQPVCIQCTQRVSIIN